MKHREYQTQALTSSKEAYERGIFAQLLQLFTGGGKTVIFAFIRKFFGFRKKGLILVHTDELAEQAVAKLEAWNPDTKIGVEMSTRRAAPDDVFVVGSVATLGRDGSTRIEAFDPKEFDFVVVDEAHHAPADSYQRILRYFGFGTGLDNEGRLLLGVTATPKRGDGQGLDKTFQEIVFQFSMLRAIREGWQVNFKPYRVRTEVRLDSIKDLDNNKRELSLAVNTPKRNAEIVEKWKEVGEGFKTIGFTVDIEHAQCLAKAFNDAGISAEAIWGDDPDRKQKLRDHKAGVFKVLLNCGVLIEGYDDPTIACVILARPSGSATLVEQIIGRGGRLPEGINNLIEARAAGIPISKEYCVLIDVTDNTLRHKLCTVASLFGLPPKLNMKGALLTDIIDQIEELRDSSPETDFDGLEDLDNIQSYIESVDLFKFEWAPEVLEHSELQWHKTPRGNYLLMLPGNERITIVMNLLDKWTISGTVRGSSFQDSEPDIASALRTADGMLKLLGRVLLPSAKRETSAQWAKAPATEAQIAAITGKLTRMGKVLPDFTKMTKHEADKMWKQLYLANAA